MPSSEIAYYQRILGTMAVVLLVLIGTVRWWPAGTGSGGPSLFRDQPTDRIQIREIQPTTQAREKTPPPPAPLPPVVVPNDVVVKDELRFGDGSLQIENPEDDEQLQEGAAQTTSARQPDTEARLLKNVQPNYPQAARRNGVRARIKVEVHVSETGAVRSASITERWRLYANGSAQPVAELGYGLEEAALSAAQRSLFRPAQAKGRPVATRTVLTFTFGPSDDHVRR